MSAAPATTKLAARAHIVDAAQRTLTAARRALRACAASPRCAIASTGDLPHRFADRTERYAAAEMREAPAVRQSVSLRQRHEVHPARSHQVSIVVRAAAARPASRA